MTTDPTDPHSPDPSDAGDAAADDALQELVADVLGAIDPVPAHVLEMARGAFAWRTIDAELEALAHAELVFDSALDAAGVRDGDSARQLTFAADGVEIEVMVDDDRLMGQVVPPVPGVVELEAATSTDPDDAPARRADVDRLGSFVFHEPPSGPVRLRVIPSGADDGIDGLDAVVTAWTVL